MRDVNQILQPTGQDYVVWLYEDHDVSRVIATDGRPHVGEKLVGFERLPDGTRP